MVRYSKRTAERGAKYVEDRRGSGPRRRGGGRIGGRPTGQKAVGGIGGLIMLILAAVFGIPALAGGGGSGFQIDSTPQFDSGDAPIGDAAVVETDATEDFMRAVMASTQDTWDVIFDRSGLAYQTTTLVIFEDFVNTQGCGQATSAVGPFYCPAPSDRKVYVDFAFFQDLATRFGAPGDFAQAYVIAHEVGHHIQSITGISDAVRQAQAENPGDKNALSVRQELQADCLAGVWAFYASENLVDEANDFFIERGDIEEGLAAAASVGDDRIQAQAGVNVDPHTWTHGSAAQRVTWFKEGFDNGDADLCDPFQRNIDNP